MADVIEINDATLSGEELREQLRRNREYDAARRKLSVDEILELTQIGCPVFQGCSKDVCKRAADCDAVLTTIGNGALATFERVILAVDRAHESDNYGEVLLIVEDARLDVLQHLQGIVKARKEVIELLDEQVVALRPIAEKLQATAEKVISAVKEDLAKIGSGVDSMTSYANNQSVAENQFDHFARHCNSRAKDAIEAARVAKLEFQAASEEAGRHRQYLALAQRRLRDAAVKSLS